MNGSPSVKVALFIRNGGSESPCRWFYVTGIYTVLHYFVKSVVYSLKIHALAEVGRTPKNTAL